MFSEYGSSRPYRAASVATQLTFFQNNYWSGNVYAGPTHFYAWNQGSGKNPVSWVDWTGKRPRGDPCGSLQDRASGSCSGPFGQDRGSRHGTGLTRR